MGDHRHQHQQGRNGVANGLELPLGFGFYPSDKEIITCYLRPRVLDHSFTALAIGDANLNKLEPWELPLMANMGEKEWYFYCRNDRKYSTGVRANRATDAGYWKATGKDKNIYHGESIESVLVGMKKTLVFYKGRAPKGVKTNWVIHVYKLPDNRVWTVCRVFNKCSDIKKTLELTPTSELVYHMSMSGDNSEDLSNMSFPMPTNFPMEQEDFTMDSSTPFYSTDGTSSVLPELSPMVDMGSMGLQTNTDHFGDMMTTTQPVSFYQQVGIETSSDCRFMAELDSSPISMLSHDVRVSPDQNSGVEISSVESAKPVDSATANMDSIWKY